MRYLWILLIPLTAFAQWGDKDSDRDLRQRNLPGDVQTRAGDDPVDIPSGGVARSTALSRMIPWRQIEQWIIFEGKSNRQVFRLLNKQGPPPGGSGKVLDEEFSKKGNPFRLPSPILFGAAFHYGWSRFFSPSYHGSSSIVSRFRSMPNRKKGHSTSGPAAFRVTSYWESCRRFTGRVRRYWSRYYGGETMPQLPCEIEPLPEKRRRRRDVVTGPEPFKPPPVTTTEGALKAPVIDRGTRTTYQASDGRPIQGQNNPGHHRTSGSATLSSGQVIIDLNTNVGAGRNDLSFIDLNYVGHARSTDTSNTNTYTVYALSKNKIMIKSSSGTDTATVNFTVEGQ